MNWYSEYKWEFALIVAVGLLVSLYVGFDLRSYSIVSDDLCPNCTVPYDFGSDVYGWVAWICFCGFVSSIGLLVTVWYLSRGKKNE
jgi:hypothetical protein